MEAPRPRPPASRPKKKQFFYIHTIVDFRIPWSAVESKTEDSHFKFLVDIIRYVYKVLLRIRIRRSQERVIDFVGPRRNELRSMAHVTCA